MLARRGRAGAAIAVLAFGGCVSTGVEPDPPSVDPSAAAVVARLATSDLESTQRLYRMQVEGGSGQGTVRLTLRALAGGSFQIDAHDSFGRGLWTLRFDSGAAHLPPASSPVGRDGDAADPKHARDERAAAEPELGVPELGDTGLVIDHREEVWCRYGTTVPLPEASLGDLPLPSLPRVLVGSIPVAPAGSIETLAQGAVEYLDADGGRWRVRTEGGAIATWTYFGWGERPVLWWSRDGGGAAILSHRDGTQLRWTESVAETLAGELPPLVIPDRYAECQT